jgi:hypothetical protein
LVTYQKKKKKTASFLPIWIAPVHLERLMKQFLASNYSLLFKEDESKKKKKKKKNETKKE